jgi:hypothetical protein
VAACNTPDHTRTLHAPCVAPQGWDWGEQYDNLKAYLHRMTGRPSWRNAASWDDDCIAADLRRKMPA